MPWSWISISTDKEYQSMLEMTLGNKEYQSMLEITLGNKEYQSWKRP